MNEYLLQRASKEQLKRWGQRSQEVQMIKRMMQEPPAYRPAPGFCGFIIACSFQCETPIEHKIQLFDTGRYDSFRAIIDGEKQRGRGGWYHWTDVLAEKMPRRILTDL